METTALVYFLFLVAIGWIFRTFSSSTSDYFRGGGKMLWWMVGATAFMTQFSAWTFTGAAGKAFNDGFAVCAIFFGNALGCFLTICSLLQNRARCALSPQLRAFACVTAK